MLLYFIISINAVRIITKAKLYKENIPMYLRVSPGLCLIYSLKVMSDAREAIRVPAPPIFTPKRSSP